MPLPPEPEPSAVILVFASMLAPVIVWPIAKVPEVTALTVKTFAVIDPVTTAAGAPVDRVSTGPDAVIAEEATEVVETEPPVSVVDTV